MVQSNLHDAISILVGGEGDKVACNRSEDVVVERAGLLHNILKKRSE